ncbi:MAG TPA: hypothetical protein VMW31_04065 [Devosiaceae bacterium]|nr:hypothetical protein [Devosiaceae bacterium]
MRTLNAILLVMSVFGLVAVYALKYRAEQTAAEIGAVENRIERKTEILTTLQADWAYLNQPSSLEPVVIRNAEALGVAPITGAQFGSLDDLPMRPATEPNSEALEALLLALEAGFDPKSGNSIANP